MPQRSSGRSYPLRRCAASSAASFDAPSTAARAALSISASYYSLLATASADRRGQAQEDAEEELEKFVLSSAARQVNLPGLLQKTLQNAVEYECVTRLTFEEAELEVLRLMDSDTFARFKVSSAFEACLELCSAEQNTQSKQI